MPELPEVETIRAHLAPHLEGRRLERVEILDPRLTRPQDPREVAAELDGERITAVERRGKYLVVRFETDRALLIHLRMTGSLHHAPAGALDEDPYRRAVVTLDNGSDVGYRDVRRFGTWLLLEPGELEPYLAVKVGPEPLERRFTTRFLAASAEEPQGARKGGAPRPADGGGAREHLRRRGALVRAPPSAPPGRRARRRARSVPSTAACGARSRAASPVRARRSATTEPRTADRGRCSTSSTSTAARESRARGAGHRSRRRAPAAGARGTALHASACRAAQGTA